MKIGKTRGIYIQNVLRKLALDSSENEETNPVPPLSQSTPSLLRSDIEAPANSSGSFETNPYPEDAPPWLQTTSDHSTTSLYRPRSRPATPITPSSFSANFSIFPTNRTISPIAPFAASRHLLTPSGSLVREFNSEVSLEWFERDIAYGRNHPCYSMMPQQRLEYWEDLSSYVHSTRERKTSLGETLLRPLSQSPILENRWLSGIQVSFVPPVQHVYENQQQDLEALYQDRSPSPSLPPYNAQVPETETRRKNTTRLLLKGLTCRPETSTPTYAVVLRANPFAATPTPPPPQRYGMAYLKQKIQRGSQRIKPEHTSHDFTNPQPDTNEAATTPPPPHSSPSSSGRHPQPPFRRASCRRSRHSNHNTEEPLPSHDISRRTGPPTRLSSMIQRAPTSIRSTSDLRSAPRRSASLSVRGDNSRLADLRFRSDTARAIREAMLDPDMD